MTARIVLVGTTHPGNIGAVARAMKNMGLADLTLVAPRSFPHEDAVARASGASDILDKAVVVTSLAEAIADCRFVVAASARSRTINMPGMTVRTAAARVAAETQEGKVAAVFGPENSGLNNNDLDQCHSLMSIPTNPDFSSLNLAMAVQIFTYELRQQGDVVAVAAGDADADVPAATAEEMARFYEHLERVLEDLQFLDPDNPRYLMRRMRRLFNRARPDKNEANILRGVLSAIDRSRDSGR